MPKTQNILESEDEAFEHLRDCWRRKSADLPEALNVYMGIVALADIEDAEGETIMAPSASAPTPEHLIDPQTLTASIREVYLSADPDSPRGRAARGLLNTLRHGDLRRVADDLVSMLEEVEKFLDSDD